MKIGDRFAYGVSEFCELMGISRTNFYNLVKKGEIRTFKMVGKTLLDPKDVRAYLSALKASAGWKGDPEELEDEIAARAAVEKVNAGIERDEHLSMPREAWQKIRRGVSPTKVVREHREISIKALATSAGISEAAVVAIDAGLARGTVDELIAIARALKAPLDVIAGANIATGPK